MPEKLYLVLDGTAVAMVSGGGFGQGRGQATGERGRRPALGSTKRRLWAAMIAPGGTQRSRFAPQGSGDAVAGALQGLDHCGLAQLPAQPPDCDLDGLGERVRHLVPYPFQ